MTEAQQDRRHQRDRRGTGDSCLTADRCPRARHRARSSRCGVDEAVVLRRSASSRCVKASDRAPILFLVNSAQPAPEPARRAARPQAEYLSRTLAEAPAAQREGRRTPHRQPGLRRQIPPGAFIATALAAEHADASLPDAHPPVIDLPSMAPVDQAVDQDAEGQGRSRRLCIGPDSTTS